MAVEIRGHVALRRKWRQYPRNVLQEQCNSVDYCVGDCIPDRECCSRQCNLCLKSYNDPEYLVQYIHCIRVPRAVRITHWQCIPRRRSQH